MSELSRRALLLGSVGAALSPRVVRAQPREAVAVIPLGAFPDELLREIERGIAAELGAAVLVQPAIPLPRSAFYPPRGRYRAERILDHLRPRVRPPATRILGVTQADISTTAHGVRDWGVLGYGDVAGTACVISTFRCRMNSPSEAQTRFRMVTTCIHEVGHTLGLAHCPDTSCLMTDARGSVRTVDRTSGRLCARCRRLAGLAPRA